MRLVTISSKRQITIPKDLLESLGLDVGQKAFIEKDRDKLSLRPVAVSVVEETAGSLNTFVPSSKLGASLEEIDRETRKIVSKSLAEKA